MIDPGTASLSAGLAALLPQVEGKPRAMAHLARLLLADGQSGPALDLCRRARQAAPSDPELATLLAGVLSADVPPFHFQIVKDSRRNDAYDHALRSAVTPGSRVLEIGTGTGLLAMMAARAGASAVVTCEANPVVAAMATEIVAANGYADRVRVVAKHSTELSVETDLGGPADVLVSEILSNDVVGEGAIPAIEDAWRRLLSPDARVIPVRARVVVALAVDRRADLQRVGRVSGFELGAFNRLAQPAYQLTSDSPRLELRSEPATLFELDFGRPTTIPPGRASVPLTATGPVGGVAQWLSMDLDDEVGYSVRPAERVPSCWAVMFHPLEGLDEAATGDGVVVHGRHDRRQLHLWATAGAA